MVHHSRRKIRTRRTDTARREDAGAQLSARDDATDGEVRDREAGPRDAAPAAVPAPGAGEGAEGGRLAESVSRDIRVPQHSSARPNVSHFLLEESQRVKNSPWGPRRLTLCRNG